MSLYGDLPQAKKEAANGDAKPTAAKGWASSAAKLQPRKSSTPLAPPSSVLRAGRGGRHGGPPIVLGRGAGRGPPPAIVPASAAAQRSEPASTSGPTIVVATPLLGPGGSLFSGPAGGPLLAEYDPAVPNDYEAVTRERERRRREAEEEAERQRHRKEAEAEIERRKKEMADAAAAVLAAARAPPGSAHTQHQQQGQQPMDTEPIPDFPSTSEPGASSAAAAAAVSAEERERRLKLSGEEAFLARGRGRQQPPPAASSHLPPPSPGAGAAPGGFGAGGVPVFGGAGLGSVGGAGGGLAGAGGSGGVSVAQRLLQKMGWREGEGLGRNRQGISTPLVAHKIDARAGVIVNANEPKRQRVQGAAFSTPPSRVLALRNMVIPGEVDDDLEEEVGQELSKYGNVQDVAIFEVTQPGWPSEEAVRIFVKFDREESATRALVDLSGRFFGGRLIRVAFFDEARFESAALEPRQGEFGPEQHE